MTSGTLAPVGTFSSVNLPSGPELTHTSGEPLAAPHFSHATPGGNAATGALGT